MKQITLLTICFADFLFAPSTKAQKILYGVTAPRTGPADEAFKKRDYATAAKILTDWLDKNPSDVMARRDRAVAFSATGQYAAAVADYESLLKSDPEVAWQNYAKLLSTCPDKKLRDGARAEELAKKILELAQKRDPKSQSVFECMDTLAATYAAQGKFDDAIRWQKQAI